MSGDDRRRIEQDPYTGPTIPIRRVADGEVRRPAPAPRRTRRPAPTRHIGAILRTLALVLAGLLGIALLLGYLQVHDLAGQAVVHDPRSPGLRSLSPAAPFTLLLVGVDERTDHPEEGVRGDSLIVARIDPGGGWAALLSIPRDTLVTVRGLGEAKINAAYSHGYNNALELYGPEVTPRESGMALAAETTEQFLGIPVDYTAQVNFEGFARIIDALGGVTIDVPRPIVDEEYPTADFGVMRIEFAAGRQRMDGERALIYARTRHADSDFGRSERQQQVAQAILDELRARGPIGQALLLPKLRASLGDTVATTLPFDRPDALAALAALGTRLRPDDLLRLQLAPDTVALHEEGSFLIWDRDGVRAQVERLLRGPSVEAEAARIQVLNGTATTGLAGRVTEELSRLGLAVVPAGDAPRDDIERTVVYNLRGKPLTARRLADLLSAELYEGAPEGVVTDVDVVVILGADAAQR